MVIYGKLIHPLNRKDQSINHCVYWTFHTAAAARCAAGLHIIILKQYILYQCRSSLKAGLYLSVVSEVLHCTSQLLSSAVCRLFQNAVWWSDERWGYKIYPHCLIFGGCYRNPQSKPPETQDVCNQLSECVGVYACVCVGGGVLLGLLPQSRDKIKMNSLFSFSLCRPWRFHVLRHPQPACSH